MITPSPAGSGFAVPAVLIVSALLSTLATGLLLSTSTDTAIASAFRHAVAARQAAAAGVEWASVELAGIPDWDQVLDGSRRSSFTDGLATGSRSLADGSRVSLDVTRSLAECGRLSPCTEAERALTTAARPWGPNNPRWQLFAYGPLDLLLPPGSARAPYYVIVLVGDDPAESDDDPARDAVAPHPAAGVVRIRSEAFGPAGAHRVIEAVVARGPGPGTALRLLAVSDVR